MDVAKKQQNVTQRLWVLFALFLAGVVVAGANIATCAAESMPDPEAASQYIARQPASAQRFMVSSANPLATQAGYHILKRGGGAIDAAIATQMVLNLVEPQSSGIGGGAFIVYYDSLNEALYSYDGRETAPAGVDPALFLTPDGLPRPFFDAVNSGLSVGVPGLLRVLEMAHIRHGLLPWEQLFEPAIRLAEQGFAVSPRLHFMLEHSRGLESNAAARAYFFDPDGKPWPVGHILKNPELAQVLREIARDGADAFYHGELAAAMVAAVRQHERPGYLSLQDLAQYRALERPPLCGAYQQYQLCGMGPPSSGTLGVLQILGMLQHTPIGGSQPDSAEAVHYFSEAGRLAYADRDYYVADPSSVDVPVEALLDAQYLRSRARLINPETSMGQADPGDPAGTLQNRGADNSPEQPSTTHMSIVDGWGDVLSMTSTIESGFGSKLFVRGFLLNNELTDFSLTPYDAEGRERANRIEPGKRPRSAMTPLIVFQDGRPFMALGSPGGSAIINYVTQTLLGVFDWGLSLQEAVALPHYGSRNGPTEIEAGRGLDWLREPLEAMGHELNYTGLASGLQGVLLDADGMHGGVDPRREGVALGD